MSEIRVDTISEKTTANGVSIDGANLKDGGATLSDNLLFNASGKGVYLGVTSATASNLLNDYEEGTWTPTFLNFSGTTQRADYTKIGELVHIQMYVSGISSGTGSNAKVQNLPFVCKNNGWATTILQGAYSTSVVIARVQANASDIQFLGTNDNSLPGSDIDNSSFFVLQVTYKTDA